MAEENIRQGFILKNRDETKNYFIEKMDQNHLNSKKCKSVCTTKYVEHFLDLASSVTGCISISAFYFLLGISIGITSSATGLKACAITAEFREQKSIIMKNRQKHYKIVLLANSKLDSIEVLSCNI